MFIQRQHPFNIMGQTGPQHHTDARHKAVSHQYTSLPSTHGSIYYCTYVFILMVIERAHNYQTPVKYLLVFISNFSVSPSQLI